jgi:hypothetical protein
MATLSVGQPQRDLDGQRDMFIIAADFDLTEATTEPCEQHELPIRRTIRAYTQDQTDSPIMHRLLELLLGKVKTRQREYSITNVDTIIVLDARHLEVSGSWLNTGLLRHWIEQLFEGNNDVRVVSSSSILVPELVPV